MLLVLRTPTLITAQHPWGLLGLLGALALLAYWGALDAIVGSLLALTCPFSPLLALTRPYLPLLAVINSTSLSTIS